MAKRSSAKPRVVSVTSKKVVGGIVIRMHIDLDRIKTERDALDAIADVVKVPPGHDCSVSDRNHALIQIELKRRNIELEGRLKSIEGRIAAIECRKRSAKRSR
jgi:hypothetical protein